MRNLGFSDVEGSVQEGKEMGRGAALALLLCATFVARQLPPFNSDRKGGWSREDGQLI